MSYKRTVKYNTLSIYECPDEVFDMITADHSASEVEQGVDRTARVLYWAVETYLNMDTQEQTGATVLFLEDIETGCIIKVNPLGCQFLPWDQVNN